MPKSVEDILANAENLSKRIRDFEPSKKDEKDVKDEKDEKDEDNFDYSDMPELVEAKCYDENEETEENIVIG
jgi:hypothetical protein